MDYSFKIINSSAGSGKTFNLAIEYICRLLRSKDDEHFKAMLALTFTNKASVEMKDRILFYLSDLKHQRNKIIQEIISNKTGLDQLTVKKRSSNILEKILYNYTYFNVITIDSFTNNIIKTVTEGIENKNDSLIELDSSVYLDQVIEELFSDINPEFLANKVHSNWLGSSFHQRETFNKPLSQICPSLPEPESTNLMPETIGLLINAPGIISHELGFTLFSLISFSTRLASHTNTLAMFPFHWLQYWVSLKGDHAIIFRRSAASLFLPLRVLGKVIQVCFSFFRFGTQIIFSSDPGLTLTLSSPSMYIFGAGKSFFCING